MYMQNICWMMNKCSIECSRVWLEFIHAGIVLSAAKTGVCNLVSFSL